MLLCAGLILVASFCTNAIAIVLIISTSMFCAAIGNPCASAVVMGMSGEHVAMVGGTMNMCGNLGAALFPLAVPWLLHVTGSWNAVLLGFGTLYVAAAACWWLLKAEGSVFAPAPRGAGAGSMRERGIPRRASGTDRRSGMNDRHDRHCGELYLERRSSTLRVMRSTALSPPRRPCAQPIVAAVKTVPPFV